LYFSAVNGQACAQRNRYSQMKFGEKYELLESLTTGGVETFVANDKVRGERVLVHILEGEEQKPNQPTVQWVLEAFRRIAPEPAGVVLETGRYSGTLYAYLVTRMPDDAALQRWVQLYRAQARETMEIAAPAVKAPPKATQESEFPTAELTPKQSSAPAGSVTQPFRELDPQVKLGSAGAQPKEAPKEGERELQPPVNEKSGADKVAIDQTPDSNVVTPGIPAAPKADADRPSPGTSFSSVFAPKNFPANINAPANASPQPGEFTNFFQSPFRVEGPSEIGAATPQPVEPSRKSVGEFTAMFSPPREEPTPGAGTAGNEPPGPGFTAWFPSPNIVSRTSVPQVAPPSGLQQSVVNDPPVFPAPVKEPVIPETPPSYFGPSPAVPVAASPTFPAPVFPSPVPSPMIEKPPVSAAPSFASEGATNAFHPPASPPSPVPLPAPSGPGAYTQIISVKPSAGVAGAQKPAATGGFPSLPVPAIAPPPMPPAPAMPKITAPPPPKAPKLEKVPIPEASVSYWPLILTLTVLFFIAVLLVLYFAMKH
jgi:hypothetical protein